MGNVFDFIKKRKERIDKGLVNGIPTPYPSMHEYFPLIEKGQYYLVTGNQKSGKTQFTDNTFVFNTIDFIIKNPKKGVEVKILYFTLEMSVIEKELRYLCNLVYHDTQYNTRYSNRKLKSAYPSYKLDEKDLERLKTPYVREHFKKFKESVEYIQDCRTPSKIFARIKEECENSGKFITNEKGEESFVWDNEEKYVIAIVDHIGLIQTTFDEPTKYSAIAKLSSNYFIQLRNIYNATLVTVQQQSAEAESLASYKEKKMAPSSNNLAINKSTAQDINMAFGVFTPFRHGIEEYLDYNIYAFEDNIRFINTLAGREGGGGEVVGMYFDGDVNHFESLPPAHNLEEIREKFYSRIKSFRDLFESRGMF